MTGKMAAAVCLMVLVSGALGAAEPICTSCPGVMSSTSEVGRRCAAAAGAKMEARCCVTGTGNVIGLDLRNCSISRLDSASRLPTALAALDLSENPLQDPPPDVFWGLTDLEYIALPPNISCPGGNRAWMSVNVSADVRVCRDQRDECNSTGELALMCPENAVCAAAGPGSSQCLCAPGFSGYKCLREGSFPMLLFFGILASVTLSVSVLLWCTQRKKVKSQ